MCTVPQQRPRLPPMQARASLDRPFPAVMHQVAPWSDTLACVSPRCRRRPPCASPARRPAVTREAGTLAEQMGVRIFTADIIYHLFDQFSAYLKQASAAQRSTCQYGAAGACMLSPACWCSPRLTRLHACPACLAASSVCLAACLCLLACLPASRLYHWVSGVC